MKKSNMTIMLIISTLLVFAWAASEVGAVVIRFVVVDHREKSFTVFMSIPEGGIDERNPWTAKIEGVDLLEWSKFKKHADEYLGALILKNEYEGSKAGKSILRLLTKYPMDSFALTWNGGIAVTKEELNYAKRALETFVSDPEEYERIRKENAEKDPLNPKSQVKKLL